MNYSTERQERDAKIKVAAQRAQRKQMMILGSLVIGVIVLLVIVLGVRAVVNAAHEAEQKQARIAQIERDTTAAAESKNEKNKPPSTKAVTDDADQPGDSADPQNTTVVEPVAPKPEPVSASSIAHAQLLSLPVVSGVAANRYQRELFTQGGWGDPDRNGCDARNDILNRDLRDIVHRSGTGNCIVMTGVLDDWYSGSTVGFQRGPETSVLVQIDHLVPLSWAWKHGADQWSSEQMLRFSNDPINLVATTQEMNMPKSDSGPAFWMPPNPDATCRYLVQFTNVLSAYGLGVSEPDLSTMDTLLTACVISGQ